MVKKIVDQIKTYFLQQKIRRNKFLVVSLLSALVINVFFWLFILFKLSSITTPIPLRYNVVVGINSIGSWKIMYQLTLIGLIVWLINSFFTTFFYQRNEKILSYFLSISNCLVQILLAVIILFIVNL
ncbi:MAG: hypothetical protein KAS12_03375 [Candidatus Aenigmarchaeota archaeon]|nr:hypothetical protein [Candidatus Aenigmarchaeota archaeon]